MADMKNYLSTLDGLALDEDSIFLYDTVEIELSEHFVIETGVVGFTDDGIILEADDETMEFLGDSILGSIVSSYLYERFYKIYGENEGIQDDIKAKLKNLNKSSELIIFFENEIIKNKNILYKNIINESLFNEKKIIFIQSATDKILNEISEGLEQNNKNIKIYIFSESLEKKSKLRSLFEKDKELAVFPCYQDNERTLINYVSKEFNGYTGLTGELINLLIANSGLNRKIILSEIVKIKNFFIKKKN